MGSLKRGGRGRERSLEWRREPTNEREESCRSSQFKKRDFFWQKKHKVEREALSKKDVFDGRKRAKDEKM